jgi:hypothetical protein
MKFLHGHALSREMSKLVQPDKPLKLAIAYWGADALRLLKLDPKRRNVKVLCCLKGGASDPDIVGRFGGRARQHDKFHAKVILAKAGAIVGSANASSNGLPEEEFEATSLIEAGLFIDAPATLLEINQWFDRQFHLARTIKPADVERAKRARKNRSWTVPKRKRGLIEALEDGGAPEFGKQRIAFVF